MSKKFVKTDFGSSFKKQQKSSTPTYQSKYYKKSRPVQYYQKPASIELRKYFQVIPIDSQIKQLIDKFPRFFSEISYHPQIARSYKSKQQNSKFGYSTMQQKQIQEQVIQWQSQGQVELGNKIDPQKIKQYQNIIPIRINELKPHEIQFLEEQFKRKLKQQQKESIEEKQNINIQQIKKEEINKQLQKKQTSSDEQIQINKQVKYQKQYQITIQTKNYQEDIQYQEDDDDNKFADSQQSSDDDIFGEDQEEKQQEKQESNQQSNINHGRISYSKGLFSLFTFNLGINDEEKVWTIHNRNQGILKSSRQMDSQYLTYFKSYEFIAFKHYAYVHYESFKTNPSLQLFKFAMQQQQQQQRQQKQQMNLKQQNISYKYGNNANSNNINANNMNNNNENKRKMSNHYYKNNKKQYI